MLQSPATASFKGTAQVGTKLTAEMLFSSAEMLSTPNLWLCYSRGKEERRVKESGSFGRVELHLRGIFKGCG